MSAFSPARVPRRLALLSLQIGAIVVGLLTFEVAYRLWLRAGDRPYDAAATRASLLRAQDQTRSFVTKVELGIDKVEEPNSLAVRTLHPYTGWEIVGGHLQVDRDLAELRSRPPDDDGFDVLIVGGSVSDIFAQYGTKRLVELLSADPLLRGREIRFLGYGRGAFKEPQQAHFVLYLLSLGFRPDAVLAIDGFNEVAIGNSNGYYGASPLFPAIDAWMHLSCGGTTDRAELDDIVEVRTLQNSIERACELALNLRLHASSVLGRLALARVGSLRRRCNEASQRYADKLSARSRTSSVRGPKLPETPALVVEQAVRAWKESSRDLQAICRARGIGYLHVLQPTLHDVGSKPLTESEVKDGGMQELWIDGVHAGYPLLRAAGAELREEGVSFVDLSQVFADHAGTLYMDACHFDREGNEIFASRIAPELLAVIPGAR
jgi:hypothetical protein